MLGSLAFYLCFSTRLIKSIKPEHSCKILYVLFNYMTILGQYYLTQRFVRRRCCLPWIQHVATRKMHACSVMKHNLDRAFICEAVYIDHAVINRGSYMSAHVLLNLLNELGKRDKMRGLPSILSLFCNEFNKFNDTRARMLDSIYHMTNTLKSHFWRKNVIILSLCAQRCYGRHNVSRKSINH